MDYERHFEQDPRGVLAALIDSVTSTGTVREIAGFGSTVKFVTSSSVMVQQRVLMAKVMPWHGGTLVQISETDRGERVPVDDDPEFMRLLGMLALVQHALELSAPREL